MMGWRAIFLAVGVLWSILSLTPASAETTLAEDLTITLPKPPQVLPGDRPIAVLGGLDKITARISTMELPVGEIVSFGTLSIKALSCHSTPPEEPPETTIFLEIDEIRQGDPPMRLFTGWMFASSPALSALEHPVYDVWAIACKTP